MSNKLKMIVPKGHLLGKVMALMERVGLGLQVPERSYRPLCADSEVETKLLRTQNIPRLIELGRHDCGFTGKDWIVEQRADVVELLDLGFNPVKIVVAVPEELAVAAAPPAAFNAADFSPLSGFPPSPSSSQMTILLLSASKKAV